MTPEQIDRVFGRGRLKMATGEHVEVFREAAAPGERRRYTKRFLDTREADFGHWTEREWRILARLIGHGIGCVPDVVQFDRGALDGTQIVQTYDAGATVDQWATIIPVARQGRVYRHVFEDCAHWWALAHYCLSALHAIHDLQLVHLDIKGDNVCVPLGPPDFDPGAQGVRLYPLFEQLALIDFAFSLVSREVLANALPIGWQKTYDYQSPRLLHALEAGRNGDLQPTRELDWRCDMYSVAAMLKRYLPDDDLVHDREQVAGWSAERYHAAKALILAIRDAHDRELPHARPHQELLRLTATQLADAHMAASLEAGWTLARDANVAPVAALPLTPLTRLAPSARTIGQRSPSPLPLAPVIVSPRPMLASSRSTVRKTPSTAVSAKAPNPLPSEPRAPRAWMTALLLTFIGVGFVIAIGSHFRDRLPVLADAARAGVESARQAFNQPLPAQTPGDKRLDDRGESLSDALPPADERVGDSSQAHGTEASGRQLPREPAMPPNVASSQSASAQKAVAEQPNNELQGEGGAPEAAAAGTSRSAGVPMQRAWTSVPQAARTQAQRPAKPSLHASATTASRQRASPTASAINHSARSFPAKPSSAATPAPTTPSTETGTRVATSSGIKAPRGAGSSPAAPAASPQDSRSTSDSSADSAQSNAASALVPDVATRAPSAGVAHSISEVGDPGGPVSAPAEQNAKQAVAELPRRVEAPHAQSRPRVGFLTSLFNFAKRGGKAAPIEERHVQAAAPSSPPPRSKAAGNVQSPPATRMPATESAPPVATTAYAMGGPVAPPVVAVEAVVRPSERLTATPGGEVSRTAPEASTRAGPDVPPPPLEQAAAARPATLDTAPTGGEDPGNTTDVAERPDPVQDYFAVRARRMLAESVPRTAAYAEPEIARVLASAAGSYHPAQQRVIVEAARRRWTTSVTPVVAPTPSPAVARRLKEAARRALWSHRDLEEAFELQLRAFGANPLDPEVAGDLAVLYLRLSPPQPQVARQLIMHAMALGSARFLAPRVQDWTTFAVASALLGREDDATRALFVSSAIANNLGASCIAALSAVANYGDRLKVPVEAMLLRIQEQGRDYESPFCSWPPRWHAGTRFY